VKKILLLLVVCGFGVGSGHGMFLKNLFSKNNKISKEDQSYDKLEDDKLEYDKLEDELKNYFNLDEISNLSNKEIGVCKRVIAKLYRRIIKMENSPVGSKGSKSERLELVKKLVENLESEIEENSKTGRLENKLVNNIINKFEISNLICFAEIQYCLENTISKVVLFSVKERSAKFPCKSS
jgi:hypothetical protein